MRSVRKPYSQFQFYFQVRRGQGCNTDAGDAGLGTIKKLKNDREHLFQRFGVQIGHEATKDCDIFGRCA